MKTCYNCGAQFDEHITICPNCGAINDTNATVSLGPADNNYNYSTPVAPTQKKNNKSVTIAIIISAVAVVVALIVAVIVVTSSKKKSSVEITQPQIYEEVISNSTTTTTYETTEATEAKTVIVYNYVETPASTNVTKNTVYNYISSDYLYPSDTTLLTYEFLSTKDSEEIDLITNEIYARHGYIFKMEKYKNYFGQKSWYHGTEPDMDTVARRFNSIEQQNINIITKYRNSH